MISAVRTHIKDMSSLSAREVVLIQKTIVRCMITRITVNTHDGGSWRNHEWWWCSSQPVDSGNTSYHRWWNEEWKVSDIGWRHTRWSSSQIDVLNWDKRRTITIVRRRKVRKTMQLTTVLLSHNTSFITWVTRQISLTYGIKSFFFFLAHRLKLFNYKQQFNR